MEYHQLLDRKNVLVAGGAGFIGSHLCDELVKSNNVICVDSFITGQEENIDLLLQNSHFKFVRHNLVEPLALDKLPELDAFKVRFQGVQEIYNLACPTSPRDYNELPIETLRTNAEATQHLLDMAVTYKAKFFHASTSAVYGEPADDTPFPESYWGFIDPVGPRSCYNEGKRFAESLVVNYGAHRGVNFRIARIFNTYGPRMRMHDGRVIPDFINSALTGHEFVIYGTPQDASTFCYISDMVDGIMKLMDAGTGIFNLGSTELTTFGEVAALVQKISGTQAPVVSKPALPYLARQGVPDITKVKESLGWFPLVPMPEGLRHTIDYVRAHQGLLGMEPAAA